MLKCGDLVQCVIDTGVPWYVPQLKKGEIYEVLGVREWPKGIGLTLKEINKPRRVNDANGNFFCMTPPPYCSSRFVSVNIDISEVLIEKEVQHVSR